jgi:hypothetical protein
MINLEMLFQYVLSRSTVHETLVQKKMISLESVIKESTKEDMVLVIFRSSYLLFYGKAELIEVRRYLDIWYVTLPMIPWHVYSCSGYISTSFSPIGNSALR